MAKKRKTKAQKLKTEVRSLENTRTTDAPVSPVYTFESQKTAVKKPAPATKKVVPTHSFALQDLKKSLITCGVIIGINIGIFLLVTFGFIAV